MIEKNSCICVMFSTFFMVDNPQNPFDFLPEDDSKDMSFDNQEGQTSQGVLSALGSYKKTKDQRQGGHRHERLASIIQKDLGYLLPRVLERHGITMEGISLSRLRVSPNGHHCFLFFTGSLVKAKLKTIKSLLPSLRQEFCKIAQMRFTPTFSVDVDKEALYEEKITSLLGALDREGWDEKPLENSLPPKTNE